MCGISGIASRANRITNNHLSQLEAMTKKLQHRGPDGQSRWFDEYIALGHTRLAIQDLSDAGKQPMTSERENYASIVNGEIYNFRELRHELEELGYTFNSNCDSELIIPLFKQFGPSAFARLNGMFSIAIWHKKDRKLTIARDRMGIKPIYFHEQKCGTFLFASEIKAILAALEVNEWGIDPTGLSQYLTYQNQFGETTLFKGIKSLEPGHYLEIMETSFKKQRYINNLIPPTQSTNFQNAVNDFKDVIKKSVKRHLIGDVHVASYLSAGFDSTTIATHTSKLSSSPLATFTGSFSEGEWYDETIGANKVSRKIGSNHKNIHIDASKIMAEMDNLIEALDYPKMGMGSLPQYIVAKEASRNFKVILTGHGGDELFSGYPVYKFASLIDSLKLGMLQTFKAIRSVKKSELPHIVYFIFSKFFSKERGFYLPVLFSRNNQSKILKRNVWNSIEGHQPSLYLEALRSTSNSLYSQVFYTYLNAYLPGLLVVEDKVSMAHGLESRTPFLDNKLLSLAFRLSPEAKLHGGVLKSVVKEGALGDLPIELYSMPKKGFPFPLRKWLREEMKDWMRTRICGEESKLRLLFTDSYLRKVVENYQTSYTRHIRVLDEIPTHQIWMLLSLEAWIRTVEEKWKIKLVI